MSAYRQGWEEWKSGRNYRLLCPNFPTFQLSMSE